MILANRMKNLRSCTRKVSFFKFHGQKFTFSSFRIWPEFKQEKFQGHHSTRIVDRISCSSVGAMLSYSFKIRKKKKKKMNFSRRFVILSNFISDNWVVFVAEIVWKKERKSDHVTPRFSIEHSIIGIRVRKTICQRKKNTPEGPHYGM